MAVLLRFSFLLLLVLSRRSFLLSASCSSQRMKAISEGYLLKLTTLRVFWLRCALMKRTMSSPSGRLPSLQIIMLLIILHQQNRIYQRCTCHALHLLTPPYRPNSTTFTLSIALPPSIMILQLQQLLNKCKNNEKQSIVRSRNNSKCGFPLPKSLQPSLPPPITHSRFPLHSQQNKFVQNIILPSRLRLPPTTSCRPQAQGEEWAVEGLIVAGIQRTPDFLSFETRLVQARETEQAATQPSRGRPNGDNR